MIFIIKNTINGWSDEFQGTVFKNTKASGISNFMVKIAPIDIRCGEK